MESQLLFVGCPAYLDETETTRCELPSRVEYRYTVRSSDGPLDSAKIRCLCGHWFNGPIEALTLKPSARAGIPSPVIGASRAAGVVFTSPSGGTR